MRNISTKLISWAQCQQALLSSPENRVQGVHHETVALVSEHNAFRLKTFLGRFAREYFRVTPKHQKYTTCWHSMIPPAHIMRRQLEQLWRVLVSANSPEHQMRKNKTTGVKEAPAHSTRTVPAVARTAVVALSSTRLSLSHRL